VDEIIDLLLHKKCHQRSPFHFRFMLHFGDVMEIVDHFAQHFPAEFLMHHFPSAENDTCLHLVALFEKFPRMLDFEVIIMSFYLWPKTNLLDVYDSLLLAANLFLLTQLVLEFAVIHYPANWRISARRNFYKVKIYREGARQGFIGGENTYLFAIGANDPNFGNPDLVIDPGVFLLNTRSPLANECDYQCAGGRSVFMRVAWFECRR